MSSAAVVIGALRFKDFYGIIEMKYNMQNGCIIPEGQKKKGTTKSKKRTGVFN